MARGVIEIVWEHILRIDDRPVGVELAGVIVCRVARVISAASSVGHEGGKRPSTASKQSEKACRHILLHCERVQMIREIGNDAVVPDHLGRPVAVRDRRNNLDVVSLENGGATSGLRDEVVDFAIIVIECISLLLWVVR